MKGIIQKIIAGLVVAALLALFSAIPGFYSAIWKFVNAAWNYLSDSALVPRWLLFGLIILSGTLILRMWFLLFCALRKLQSVEQQLKDSLKKPHHFLDDYEFMERLGLYRHKENHGYFCGSCTPKQIVSRLRETEGGWRCEIRECNKFHPNPRYMPPPREASRSPGHLYPEDL